MMRLLPLRTGVLFALTASAVAPAAAATMPPDLATVVRGSVAAIDADSVPAVAAYFAPTAYIVDQVAPYQWTGPKAATRWWTAIDVANKQAGIPKIHVTMQSVNAWEVTGNVAYVVVPLKLSFEMHGKPRRESGQWGLVLSHASGTWKITSAAWAEQ